MIMKRKASAVWNGSGKDGSGNISTETGVLSEEKYSFSSRFADGKGTNPEELVAAAHAGCFSMKLSFVLGSKNLTPDTINTTCYITIEDETITGSHLEVKAKVPGASPEDFADAAEEAKNECPISRLLNTKITVTAELIG
ncbi:MAG: OsmC family protein [Chitinophagales bacterium]